MKKFLITLCAVFICGAAIAQTIRWHIGDTVYETTTCNAGESITPPTAPDKFGYSFKKWVEYIPIEYLESTGTQWVDSGVTLSNRLAVETVFQTTSVDRQMLFGDSTYYNNNQRFYLDIINNNFRLARGTGYVEFTRADTNKHTLRFSTNSTDVLWDGNLITIQGDWNRLSTDTTVKIFASSPITQYLSQVKYYSFKIYKNYELVRDFIPVLDGNGTPCMYDKVERKFYYNAGTGQFIAGPIIGSVE